MEGAFRNSNEVYNFFISKKILISQDLMDYLIEKEFNPKQCERVLTSADIKNCVIMNLDIFNMIEESEYFQINWSEFDGSLVEKDFDSNSKKYETFIDFIDSNTLKKNSFNKKTSFKKRLPTKENLDKRIHNLSGASSSKGFDKNVGHDKNIENKEKGERSKTTHTNDINNTNNINELNKINDTNDIQEIDDFHNTNITDSNNNNHNIRSKEFEINKTDSNKINIKNIKSKNQYDSNNKSDSDNLCDDENNYKCNSDNENNGNNRDSENYNKDNSNKNNNSDIKNNHDDYIDNNKKEFNKKEFKSLDSSNNLNVNNYPENNPECNCDTNLEDDITNQKGLHYKKVENPCSNTKHENFEQHYDLEQIKLKEPDFGNFEILFNYEEMDKKREIGDFISFFKHRYEFLKGVLSSRNQLSSTVSIKRIIVKNTNDRNESVAVIGLINSISKTQKGNYIISVEDPTGSINVMVSSDNPELIELCEDLVLDEVIGIEGALSKHMIYATRIYKPDIPFGATIKKSPDEVYALFLSDIHVGSNMFLEEDLNRFLKWINQESGSEEQKRVAGLVKYIFVLGDVVDGVGIYPGQEKELDIKDIYKQYEKAAEFIKRIPIEKNIFIIPGNHDALRLSEPQPQLSKLYASSFYNIPNVTLLTNPSSIRIHKKAGFPGFDVLMYHGYSFDYYVANVDTIRRQGGYDRADLIMKFLLHTRHLAPTHTSSLYVPETRDDFLMIKQVPDFFVTGHIHKTSVSNYKGITLISGSCWQGRTSFQEKVGHHPEPSRVPIVNLNTREVKILNFSR